MPRNWSTAVYAGNDPVRHDEVGPDELTLADLYRMIEELVDKSDRKLDELADERRATKKRLVGLEQVSRQPRLTMEGDIPTYKRLASARRASLL